MEEVIADGAGTSGGRNGSVSLPDELSRRLNCSEPVYSETPSTSGRVYYRLLCEERHDAGAEGGPARAPDAGLVSKWRQKEKLKTTAVALVLCLNIGVDPPDVIKISPCARLECWVDPLSMQPAKALETIGKNLQAQYERWQPRAKYKMHLDPTVDDVKKLATSCRRTAKVNERVLFHYNGHGVPRPTANGEVWVFNSRYTQYIPLSCYELHSWLGTPAIYVLDCSAAGLIINSFKALLDARPPGPDMLGAPGGFGGAAPAADPMKELIVLAACGPNELLPQNPDLPADVFSACLTTPIRVALRWACCRSLLRHDGITKELVDRLPGRQTDRKTPLGELNWIFTAITDTIAWNSLPRPLFQKLFRQDLLVASLFRNFLLAERIMAAAGCTPCSLPRLPPTHHHPMWQAWDMAAEMCLLQLPGLLADPPAEFVPSTFFAKQLTAFELWLAAGSRDKRPPEQLPIVLQVLLSQVHRLRALVLLARFLDMGSWAVDLALSVGIFPYVLKLLQTTSSELRATLVFIWAKVLALDCSCQADLVKDNGHGYFIKYLDSAADAGVDAAGRAQAAFVLAVVCRGHPRGQALCTQAGLLPVLIKWLRAAMVALRIPVGGPPPPPLTGAGWVPLLAKWLCLCLGCLAADMPDVAAVALREGVAGLLSSLLGAPSPEIRAAALFALGSLLGPTPPGDAGGAADEGVLAAEQAAAALMLRLVYDASPLVRAELGAALGRFVVAHMEGLQDAVAFEQRRLAELMRAYQRSVLDEAAAAAVPVSTDGATGGSSDSLRRSASSGSIVAGGTQWGSAQSGSAAAAAGGSGRLADADALKPGSAEQTLQRLQVLQLGSPGAEGRWGAAAADQARQQAGLTADGGLGGEGDADAAGTGLYASLLEAVLMLATDPSPQVAAAGRQVLRLAQVELAPLSAVAAPPRSHGAGGAGSAGVSPAAASGAAATSLGSLTSKFVKSGRSWRSGFASGSAGVPRGAPGAPSVGGSTPSGSPPSPNGRPLAPLDLGATYSRHPYMLLSTQQQHQHQEDGEGGGGRGMTQQGSDEHLAGGGDARAHGGASGLAHLGGAARDAYASPAPAVDLPQSHIFPTACTYFSRPMLEPQATAWREVEGVQAAPWTGASDPARKSARAREMEAAAARCRAITSPRLRESPTIIETGGEAVECVVFHSFHLLLVSADERGYIRVNNGLDAANLNTFRVTDGSPPGDPRASLAPPARVVYMRQLNEADSNLLLCGGADGAVRIWRSYLHAGQQRLATAWQAVPIHQPPVPATRPAAYALAPSLASLAAAGGCHPHVVHLWDLSCETASHAIGVRSSAAASGAPVAVERLSAAAADPSLLLVGCSDRVMRLYDLRVPPQPVAALPSGRSPLVGMVLEPAGRSSTVVTAGADGDLHLLDLRLAGAGGEDAGTGPDILTIRSLPQRDTPPGAPPPRAERLTALAAHPNASLLATGSSAQEVRVWMHTGELVSAVRPRADAARAGATTALAWHPYNLYLGAGGRDSTAWVFQYDGHGDGGGGALRTSSLMASSSRGSHAGSVMG